MTSVVPCLLSAPWASLPCSHFSIFLLSLLLFLLSLTSSLLLAPHALGVSLLGAAALGGPSPATSFGRIVLLVFRLQGGVCGIGLGLVVLACLIVLAGSGCPSFATPAGLAVVVLSSQTLHDRDILVLTVVHLGTIDFGTLRDSVLLSVSALTQGLDKKIQLTVGVVWGGQSQWFPNCQWFLTE